MICNNCFLLGLTLFMTGMLFFFNGLSFTGIIGMGAGVFTIINSINNDL